MKILLTNDDGFEAEGLQCLYQVLSQHHECYVVAPDQGRSCCSHAVTTSSQLSLVRKDIDHWSVSGTPVDCVRIALQWLQIKPDVVISGINHGGNLGVDILYSGTVAAAREASRIGLPAIAISQYMRRDVERDWTIIAQRGHHVIASVLQRVVQANAFCSLNLPALPPDSKACDFPISECKPEHGLLVYSFEKLEADVPDATKQFARIPTISGQLEDHSVIYRSNYQARPREPGSDVDLCFQGHATVTWLDARIPL